MVSKIYVLYHGVAVGKTAEAGCYDGFGAAFSVWRTLKDEASYLPVAYGQPVPELVPDSIVYIVDFSYPRDALLKLAETHKRVVVLDHHKTAEEALRGLEHPNLEIVFDMARSGALITWEHFHKSEAPWLIRYISDRDLWKFQYPETKWVHTYLQSLPFDFAAWEKAAEDLEHRERRDYIFYQGQAIERFRDSQVKIMCRQARIENIAGFEVPSVNATCFWSEVGHELLAIYPSADFVAVWFIRADGEKQVSLRSRPGFDCSRIAKLFNGGGHAQASGFSVKAEQSLAKEKMVEAGESLNVRVISKKGS